MIDAEEFDRLADSGSDEIDKYLDWAHATRPGLNDLLEQITPENQPPLIDWGPPVGEEFW